MGVRIEYILVILIILTVIVATKVNVAPADSIVDTGTKELEFRDTTFVEVTTQKREGIAHAAYGLRQNGILTLHKLRYHSGRIKEMSAERAHYRERMIYLEGNVYLLDQKGFRFETQEAVYEREAERIRVTAPFHAYFDANSIAGESLLYDMVSQVLYAEKIDARIVMEGYE
jgi:hypothetical protein